MTDSLSVQKLVERFGDLRRWPKARGKRIPYNDAQQQARLHFREMLQPTIDELIASQLWMLDRPSSYGEWYLKPGPRLAESTVDGVYITPADWRMTVAFRPRLNQRGPLRTALAAANIDFKEDATDDAEHDVKASVFLTNLLGKKELEEWSDALSSFVRRVVAAAAGAKPRAPVP